MNEKYYQVSIPKQKLIVDNVSFYLQQAYDIYHNISTKGSDGVEDVFYGDNRDVGVAMIAQMLQKEDHFIRSKEISLNDH